MTDPAGGGIKCMIVVADENEAATLVGKRVEGGEGEDHDAGVVLDVIDANTVLVAWDSQVRTPADVSSLRLA